MATYNITRFMIAVLVVSVSESKAI